MRVFVTGATGWVGSALIPELLAHGHQVLALARSESTAASLKEKGVDVLRGSLEDLDVLAAGAGTCEGTIHLAFTASFDDFEHHCAAERAALGAMAEAMAGSGNPLIMTTGTFVVMDVDGARGGQPATEEADPLRNTPPFSEKVKVEDLMLHLTKTKGIRGMIMRLAPTVHGRGDKRFIAQLGEISVKNGKALYVGDGQARWPAVHRKDAAAAFRLALEKGKAGAIYHAVAEPGIPTRDIMQAIGRKVGVRAESVSSEEAIQSMGMFGNLITLDDPVLSDKTRQDLGWEPREISLLDDIEQNYFLAF